MEKDEKCKIYLIRTGNVLEEIPKEYAEEFLSLEYPMLIIDPISGVNFLLNAGHSEEFLFNVMIVTKNVARINKFPIIRITRNEAIHILERLKNIDNE